MVNSVKQNSDAIKALPVVRSYVGRSEQGTDPSRLQAPSKWYRREGPLRAGQGGADGEGQEDARRRRRWLNEHKEEGSELLVAAFADPSEPPDFALTVTQKQSEVVVEYLRSQHKVHRTGWWWWSTRSVRAIGCGVQPSPVPETEKLPAARIELIVFVPQK